MLFLFVTGDAHRYTFSYVSGTVPAGCHSALSPRRDPPAGVLLSGWRNGRDSLGQSGTAFMQRVQREIAVEVLGGLAEKPLFVSGAHGICGRTCAHACNAVRKFLMTVVRVTACDRVPGRVWPARKSLMGTVTCLGLAMPQTLSVLCTTCCYCPTMRTVLEAKLMWRGFGFR